MSQSTPVQGVADYRGDATTRRESQLPRSLIRDSPQVIPLRHGHGPDPNKEKSARRSSSTCSSWVSNGANPGRIRGRPCPLPGV